MLNSCKLSHKRMFKTVRSSQCHSKAGEPEPRFRRAQASTDSGSRFRMIPSWSALKRHRPDHDRTSNTLNILQRILLSVTKTTSINWGNRTPLPSSLQRYLMSRSNHNVAIHKSWSTSVRHATDFELPKFVAS